MFLLNCVPKKYKNNLLLKLQHLQNSHILTSPCDNITVMFFSWTLKVGLNQPSCQERVPLESVLRVLSAALSDSASVF